jgi:hypothetical protein
MNAASPIATVDQIRRHLVALKMPSALEGLDNLVRRFEQGQISPLDLVETLLEQARGLRVSRRVKMALLTAPLTTLRTLESFDFRFQPAHNSILLHARSGSFPWTTRHRQISFGRRARLGGRSRWQERVLLDARAW